MKRTLLEILSLVLAPFLLVGIVIGFIKLSAWCLPPMLHFIVDFYFWWWSQVDLIRFWVIPSCVLATIILGIYLDSKYRGDL